MLQSSGIPQRLNFVVVQLSKLERGREAKAEERGEEGQGKADVEQQLEASGMGGGLNGQGTTYFFGGGQNIWV